MPNRLQSWLLPPDPPLRERLRLALPAGLLADAAVLAAAWLPLVYARLIEAEPAWERPFAVAGAAGLLNLLAVAAGFAGAWLGLAFILLMTRRRTALPLLRKGFLCFAAWTALGAYVVLRLTALLFDRGLSFGGVKPDAVLLFHWRWQLLWPLLAGLLLAGLGYLLAWRRPAMAALAGDLRAEPAAGDRVLENLRTGGPDPRFRKSVLGSCSAHLLVIVILPFLLQFVGCVEPYRVPKGSGNPVVALLKSVPVKPKKEKRKQFIVNPNSAISFMVPDLDDSKILKVVDEQTQVTYQADPNRVHATLGTAQAGKMGVGGGRQGGWPDGMENARVRFIRLEYAGSRWDDGMDAVARADLNFLDAFHKLTGFKVSNKPESHPVMLLRRYRKGSAPPFVYMTGDRDIRLSATELRTLREYLLDGGLLFADCGGVRWDGAFRAFAAQLFPGEKLLTIADDDPIFQVPYAFANGAPPLWHHGGSRALGIKHKGRWVVFYHPGDINDAWKTGHSGMDSRLAEGATQMGVNVIYYAFTHYLEMTRKYRP